MGILTEDMKRVVCEPRWEHHYEAFKRGSQEATNE